MANLRKNANWPADRVERWPVAKLVPNARNARTHSDDQVTQIAASIEEWGWTIPVLVDEAGGIIAGHGRIMAAHRLGLEDVPVMVAAGWSDAKKRAYMLADNKLTLNGEWDLDRLAIEIAELRASDFDISLIGFSESDIDDLLKADEDGGETGAGSLAERFMIPPFSVLSARGGWWQERKAAWLALGIQSELGRGENMLGMSASNDAYMYDKKNYVKANAIPGGAPMPIDRAKAAKATAEPSKMPAANYRKTHARGDGRGRAIDPQG
jgi:ParB-like chromosome segregation protein Spo0J